MSGDQDVQPSEDQRATWRQRASEKIEAGTLLTPDETAAWLHICRRTLQEHVRHGSIKYIAVGRGLKRRRKMFHPDDIKTFVDAQRTTEWVLPVELRTSSRRRKTQPEPVYRDFLAERAARRAAEWAASEKRNGWAPGTLERRAQKREAELKKKLALRGTK